MKMTRTLLVAAIAAAGLAATSAQAQRHGGGSHTGGWSGHHGASVGRHYGGYYHGGGRYWGGGYRYWGPSYAFYVGAPLLWGSYYWGGPWWDGYYYPRSTVVYTDRVVVPYPEGEVSSTEVPRSEGAPTQAPAYRNYCESAKAYYPKVTKCPEGWRFEPSR